MTSVLLQNNGSKKYVAFTPDAAASITEYCDLQESSIWLSSEINLTQDIHQFEKLTPEEQLFLKQILAYFAASDGLVGNNIANNFVDTVTIPEVRYFYYFQMMMEAVHSRTYSQLISTFVTNSTERDDLFSAMETHPIIKKKGEWSTKWMTGDKSFWHKLIAFIAVEGIFFAGSFAAIFWFRDRGILANSLGVANEFIMRDETLHAEFAAFLYNQFADEDAPSKQEITDILIQACELEKEFSNYILPSKLLGMSAQKLNQYLEFITDVWLEALGCEKFYNSDQPFAFMNTIGQRRKDNIFEKSRTNYTRSTEAAVMDWSQIAF